MMETKKSIFQRAGEWGIPFGLYLSCAGVISVFADNSPLLNILFWAMVFATPYLVCRYQRRKFIEDDGFTEYAGLWMLGIMLFILGSLISSFIVFIVLQYIRPGFIYEQAQAAIQVYEQVPQMSEMTKVLKRMIEERLLPSPIEMVFNVFWFISFFGSLTSAVTALIAQRRIKRPTNNNNQ